MSRALSRILAIVRPTFVRMPSGVLSTVRCDGACQPLSM